MKHDAAHYEAQALDLIGGATAGLRQNDIAAVQVALATAQVAATLAVAAATLEAQRPHYPPNHPLGSEA